MKKSLLFLCLLMISNGLAQEKIIKPQLVSTLTLVADEFFGSDSFGYVYFSKANVFYKQKNKELFQYKNLALGKIKGVDLQNPLKIVLFYEGFNSVVTLDNQLNETLLFNFSKNQNNPIVTSAVGLASQNRLWLFNSLPMQLGLYDFNKQQWQSLSQPFQSPIHYYQTDYNNFYWADSNNNIYSCDIFGKINTLGTIPKFDAVQIISYEKVVFQIENKIFLHDLKDNSTIEIQTDKKMIQNFQVKDQFLFIFTENEISKYQINLP